MRLNQLQLLNFKNHASTELSLQGKIVCFTGLNGMGKTNLLDAIHYLSAGKSSFNSIDSQNILKGEKYFTVTGAFQVDSEAYKVFCGFTQGRKKVLKLNDAEYEKLIEHYGRFPCVLVSPLDVNLITGSSEERRKFIDSSISLFDKAYLETLVKYNHVLAQRNKLLKQTREGAALNKGLLKVYDAQLAQLCEVLYPKRSAFIEELSPLFAQYVSDINLEQEALSLHYLSQLQKAPLLDLLEKNLDRDLILARTESGIHKDKLEFGIDGMPLKKFGSQGQQKSYVLALKLAQAKLVEGKTGRKPILLLDDLFDRLDDKRAARLLVLVDEIFDQLFITDTSQERLNKALKAAKKDAEFFSVSQGQVT